MILGGVPEHFNFPWHQLISRNGGIIENTPVSWQDFPGGTGAMVEALENDKIQIALLLTEGAVSAICKGADLKIVSPYVVTPLVWGIHVPANSPIEYAEETRGETIAISRYGSGSHLMAFVDAHERSWATHKLQFEVVGNLEGARQSFKEGRSSVFLWEKYTTKPYVDSGEFRRVGERPTPWPCFMLVAKSKFLEQHKVFVVKLLEQLYATTKECEQDPDLIHKISEMYKLDEQDLQQWKAGTQWASNSTLKAAELDTVSDYLFELKLIDQKLPANLLCSTFVNLV